MGFRLKHNGNWNKKDLTWQRHGTGKDGQNAYGTGKIWQPGRLIATWPTASRWLLWAHFPNMFQLKQIRQNLRSAMAQLFWMMDHGVFPLRTLVAWSRLLRSVAFRNERKGDAIHLRVGGCRAAWAYVPWCPKSLNFHGSPIAGWLWYVMMVEFMENPTQWHGCFRGMVDRGIQWQLLDEKLVWISSFGSRIRA